MYVIDPDARREIRDRLGSGFDRIQHGAVPEGVTIDSGSEPFVEALWEAWVQTTFTLIAFGFPQRALCDAAAEMVSVKEETGENLVTH